MGLTALGQRDLSRVWHPCMQMKDFESIPLICVSEASGVYLIDENNNRYIDAISSWWVNLFGHANGYINQKITEQLGSFAHVMTANFTHEPMVRLSERLCDRTQGALSRVFFADNGSSAIEAAMKMAYQYHQNIGKPRSRFVCFSGSYHGETIGALSVGDVGLYRETFEKLLLSPIVAKSPLDKSEEAATAALGELEKLLLSDGGSVAAMIVEPLVQCAGGMRMHSPSFIAGLRRVCDTHGILLIFDEIAVGFGRTGSFFAHEQSGVRPDLLCLSKGITGGYLPLSVVMTTDVIYEAFYDDYRSGKAFLHSHSYSGNALGCASANAVLDIFDSSDILGENSAKSELILKHLECLKDNESVLELRQTGMITAVELHAKERGERLALRVFRRALELGVFLRPLGNVIYIMPPYIIDDDEIKVVTDAVKTCIQEL